MVDSEVRNLLPVKQTNGKWIYRTEVIKNDNIKVSDSSDINEIQKKKGVSVGTTHCLVEKYANEQKRLKLIKAKIAMLCHSVTTNPETCMRALKELIGMLQKPRTKMIVTEKKLLSISLLHVFNDILPGYKIRNMQETDTKLKLKKQTKLLLHHELALLRYYKKYIDLLQCMVNAMKCKRNQIVISSTEKKARQEIGITATRCLCELLVNRYYFNYYKTIINIVIPLVGNRNSVVSDICCAAVQKLYKVDKLGEASLEAVKQTVKIVKERNFCVPCELLKTFLALNLQEAKTSEKNSKKDMKKIRKELSSMSRKEKKYKKKMRELEQQLRETEAHESKETKSKLQTEILKKIFWVYFHVLKDNGKIGLITPVLEGLSKFAHLINLEFFDDLNAVLCHLMENENLGDTEKLHCMQTVFIILSGQAESLNVDPQRLYSNFYHILLNLQHSTTVEQCKVALHCMDLMLIKRRKKITFNRTVAFIKRLCTVCLQTPVHFTLAIMCIVRTLLMDTKNSDILLDTENVIGSGIFLAELDDPEYCNAASTCVWELHLLLQHFNPIVSDYARHILHGCPIQGKLRLPEQLSKNTPERILETFSAHNMENGFEFEKCRRPAKKLCVRKNDPDSVAHFKESDFLLSTDHVKNVDFLSKQMLI